MPQLLLSPPTDDRLALSARDGDLFARNYLYLRHASLIRNRTIPAQRLADKLDASGAPINGEDVEQQCFLIFCLLLETWDPDRTPFLPYLADSISRAAYAYVRQFQHLRSTRVKLVHTPIDFLDPSQDDPDDPGSTSLTSTHPDLIANDITQDVLVNDLWDTISSYLYSDLARLVRQRFWEDKSIEQIARTTGRSRRTVDRAIQSAIATLQLEASQVWQTG